MYNQRDVLIGTPEIIDRFAIIRSVMLQFSRSYGQGGRHKDNRADSFFDVFRRSKRVSRTAIQFGPSDGGLWVPEEGAFQFGGLRHDPEYRAGVIGQYRRSWKETNCGQLNTHFFIYEQEHNAQILSKK